MIGQMTTSSDSLALWWYVCVQDKSWLGHDSIRVPRYLYDAKSLTLPDTTIVGLTNQDVNNRDTTRTKMEVVATRPFQNLPNVHRSVIEGSSTLRIYSLRIFRGSIFLKKV